MFGYLGEHANFQFHLFVKDTGICQLSGQTTSSKQIPTIHLELQASISQVVSAESIQYYSLSRRATFSQIRSTRQQTLNHILLVHKTFHRSIFNIVKLNSAPGSPPALIFQDQGPPSLDLRWGPLLPLHNPTPSLPMLVQCGETKEGEEEGKKSKVCVAWTIPPILEGNATVVLHTVVASSLKEVEEEVEQVKGLSVEQLLGKHTRAWEKVWIEGRVEVDSSDLELSSTIIGSQFYLLSSLPSTSEVNCGMSPGSLAKGGPMADYEGHSFWDSEVNFPTSN